MPNRDSLIWLFGIIGAILTALANETGLFPPEWYRIIHALALVFGIISGKLSTSPLKGANNGK